MQYRTKPLARSVIRVEATSLMENENERSHLSNRAFKKRALNCISIWPTSHSPVSNTRWTRCGFRDPMCSLHSDTPRSFELR